jgi:type II secretory pathway component PulJ
MTKCEAEFEAAYRRIGDLKRRRAALEADLRGAAAYRLTFREALMDRIRCTDAELDEAFRKLTVVQNGMQIDLFGG